MAGLADVIERLLRDPGFRAELISDPKSALAGYQLTGDQLQQLARWVGEDDDADSDVERRTSRSGFFGLFADLAANDPHDRNDPG